MHATRRQGLRGWKAARRLCIAAAGAVVSMAAGMPAQAQKPSAPAAGAYIGAILPDEPGAIRSFNAAIGVPHAAFLSFYAFPDVARAEGADRKRLGGFIADCRAAGAIPAITLETVAGLDSYGTEDVESFADFLNGIPGPVFVRWNHEMNGSWYAWGQQPRKYIQRFREFADVIHQRAPRAAMVWTPNQGWGYPWPQGAHAAKTASPDFALLDTDGDGRLDESDDPYGPYYPGDAYVDWVGISFYHWGEGAQRGANEVPPAGKWAAAMGIGRPALSFHDAFAVGHRKPMMIAETSALFDPADKFGGYASEEDIKGTWIRQVYNLTDAGQARLDHDLPMIKAIFWFNIQKHEQEVAGMVSWRVDANPKVREEYRQAVASSYFLKSAIKLDTIRIVFAPETVADGESWEIQIEYSADGERDVAVNLLSPADNYSWHGGGVVSVAPGRGKVTVPARIEAGVKPGTNYIWDVFITPRGSDWREAGVKLQVPVTVVHP